MTNKNQVDERCAAPDDKVRVAARTFSEAGYMVLEDIYTAEWVASLRVAYEKLVARYLSDQGGLQALEGKTFGKNHIGIHPALFAPWSDPQIVAHPKIDALLTELLGIDYRCGYYHSNAAYPGSGVQPIHRDTAPLFAGVEMSVPHPVVSIVLNVPLCDFTIENGSTEVWPGTHLMVDRTPTESRGLEERAAALPSQRTNVRAGSVILRDLRLFHRGMPNHSDQVRAMLAIVYVRPFQATAVLDIPQSSWSGWPERARHIFRNNHVIPDDASPPHYRQTKSAQ